ncbi:hypothetical protein B0H14DRAFT_3468653 [Mycena olivaceomarginata]|nr:hypothetical protein B0H14DRAFT_3468653 [Mycena olivaceomarginata]
MYTCRALTPTHHLATGTERQFRSHRFPVQFLFLFSFWPVLVLVLSSRRFR